MSSKNTTISTRVAEQARPAANTTKVLRETLGYAALGLLALLPRLLNLGQYLTDDEANFWLRRSQAFLDALASGDYAATAISTHPGVTTMWLGVAGIVLRKTLFAWGWLESDPFPLVLALFRLPVVLVHVASVLLGYRMLRLLLPATPAGLAALLWAADPFFVGYSRLLHVDALMGTFATLSLLAFCCYERSERRRGWLVLSGVCAGLAMLSKSPGLVLVPAVGLAALLAHWRQTGSLWPTGALLRRLTVWTLVCLITVFALWPALWASPLAAYNELRSGVVDEGAQPHMNGNFFLGQKDDAPGLAYYPVALALRLTPWTLLGLLLLPLAWRRDKTLGAARPSLAALAGFVLLFVAAMSLFPKKFDRYLVPVFPALDVLAAVGLAWLAGLLLRRWLPSTQQAVALLAMGALAVANVAWWHPYELVAYNQLLGGAPTGARTFALGWSEGLEQVAAWLNQQPDITGVSVTAERVTSLNPYLRRGAQADFPRAGQLHDDDGYVVVYLAQVRAGPPPPPFDQFYGRAVPLHIVRIHGVDYAWIYQVPPPVASPRPARFGSAIELRGYELRHTPQPGQPLDLRLFWATSALPERDYWLFAHLVDAEGRRVSQIDQPYSSSTWTPGRAALTELPLPLPAELAAGSYRLIIGLYDPTTGQRLSLSGADAAKPGLAGPDALELLRIE